MHAEGVPARVRRRPPGRVHEHQLPVAGGGAGGDHGGHRGGRVLTRFEPVQQPGAQAGIGDVLRGGRAHARPQMGAAGRDRARIRLIQLADEPLALLDLPQSRDYFRGMFAAAGVEPNIRYRSSSVETLRALVGHGLDCTLLNLRPAVATSLLGHPVVSLALEVSGTPLNVVLVTAAGGRPTRRAAAVAAPSAEVLRRRGARTGQSAIPA